MQLAFILCYSEYVKNPNFIFKYNCPRKHEFLRKGLGWCYRSSCHCGLRIVIQLFPFLLQNNIVLR